MSKEDMNKLYEVSQDEINTKTRVLFPPPVNMVLEPIIYLGKTKDSLIPYKCEGFQGTYASEHVYLNTLCSYITTFWNETFNSEEPIAFSLDLNRLQRSLRARIGTAETPFAFMTNDYRLQKILGYSKFEDNQIFESQVQSIKQTNNETKKLETVTVQVIDFPRVMYIRGFRYLNLIYYDLSQHTHRENNEIRYILLRSYYDFQNGIYAELPGNYDVIFSCNSLAHGIRISFQDENYREIDLEGEPFTLQLFISPSARMIEKRAFTQAVEQQFKEQQAEKIKQEKEQKDKKDKEDKDKQDKQDKLQIKKDKIEQNKRDESLFKVLGKVIKLNKQYYQQQNSEIKENWKNLISAFELKNIEHDKIQKQLTEYTKQINDKTDAQEKQFNSSTGQLIAELKNIQQNQRASVNQVSSKLQESNNIEIQKTQNIKQLLEEQITQNINAFQSMKNIIENTSKQFINEILKHQNVNDLKDAEKTIEQKIETQKLKLQDQKETSIKTLNQIKKLDETMTEQCELNISIIETEYSIIEESSLISENNRNNMIAAVRNNPDVSEQHKIVQQFRENQNQVLKTLTQSSQNINAIEKQINNYIQDKYQVPAIKAKIENDTFLQNTLSHSEHNVQNHNTLKLVGPID
ncbi:Hypothetical_protein [Hexamita inflata]|uniref:Hypothetical_protein n=1 Tax=Hexamita inflata TaxID=28002 RepID=A0AA86P3A7_9EUKA|nr:Hypothetical protein HINF_LOCUS18724 [Hexamita inflata]